MKISKIVLILFAFGSAIPLQSCIAEATNCPTLSGKYTLTYRLIFIKPDSGLSYIKNANFADPSTVTVSSDGSHFLWRMQNNSWHKVVIYDTEKALTYYYDSVGVNAGIQKGATGWATSNMRYVPFPAASLSDIPFLRSISCSGRGKGCSGSILIPSATSFNHEATYGPADVVFGTWNSHTVISSCSLVDHPQPLMDWTFNDFELFEQIPIAKQIRITSKIFGNSDVLFSLVRAVPTALPAKNYEIETYLQPGVNSIDDHSTNRAASYVYNPKLGDLNAQREAEYVHDDQRSGRVNKGTGPDKTKSGIFVLLALVLFGVIAAVRARAKRSA